MGLGASRTAPVSQVDGNIKQGKRPRTVSLSDQQQPRGVLMRKSRGSSSGRSGSLSAASNGSKASRESRDSRLLKHMSFYEMVDASEVSPYLIVGNQPCVENEDFLSRKKVSFVLNLSNMAVPTILNGIEYKTILLDDEDDEDFLNHLEECLAFMQKAKERCAVTKSRILVYSYFGLSRCCSVCVAHLMKENGWTLRQAWNYLRQCRPAAKPSDGFLLQLMQYEGSLHGKLSMTMQDFYAR